MSVICYNPEKFQKIGVSLKKYKASIRYDCDIQCWAQVFGYPEGWNQGTEILEYRIDAFLNDLYRANQQTYLRQYEDKKFEIEALPQINREKPYENKAALYKALQSIRYNIYDNAGNVSDFNGCKEILASIIKEVADDIISELPEYELADVW